MRRAGRSILAVVLIGALGWAGAPAGATVDLLATTANTTYTLVPSRGIVRVAIALTITNQHRNQVRRGPCPSDHARTCIITTSFYSDRFDYLFVQQQARFLQVTADDGPASLRVAKRLKGWRLVSLHFPRILYGQSRHLRVTFELPGGKPRSDEPTRAGKAYVSFCMPGQGTDSAVVTAILPGGFKVDTFGDRLRVSRRGSTVRLSSGMLRAPEEYWSCVDGTNEAAFATTGVTSPSGREIDVEGWPEDRTWRTRLQAAVETVLPRLEGLVGSGIPGDGPITVREVAASQLGGYAGDYATATDFVRVSENAGTTETLAHELAHAWFNERTFSETWLAEGHAEWAGTRVSDLVCTDPGEYPGVGAANLAKWRFLRPKSTDKDRAVVDFQYAAACYVVTTIANTLGPTEMRRVMTDLLGHEAAYGGPTVEAAARPTAAVAGDAIQATIVGADWRTWLDTVEEGGAVPLDDGDSTAIEDLLARFGIDADPDALAARAQARRAYDTLIAESGGLAPAVLRASMTDWRFDEVPAAVAATTPVVADILEIEHLLPGTHLTMGLRFELGAAASLATVLEVGAAATVVHEGVVSVTRAIAEFKAARPGCDLPDAVYDTIELGAFDVARTIIVSVPAGAQGCAPMPSGSSGSP